MAYQPSPIAFDIWGSPISIVGSDRIQYLDEAVNDIITEDPASLVNFVNAQMARLPQYFVDELGKMNVDNIQEAQLSMWISEAEAMTADSYATEAVNVPVKIYTSNGDGTFTITDTTEYSSYHWSIESATASGNAIKWTDTKTATEAQKIFTASRDVAGSSVFVNGSLLTLNEDYTVSTNEVTLVKPAELDDTITITGGDPSSSFPDDIIQTVDTIDNMILVDHNVFKTVVVRDENRGGTFSYDASQSGTNNSGTIFDGWVRQYDNNEVSVAWFGAKGDGVTFDSDAIQLAIDSEAKSIRFGSGIYVIDKTLLIKSIKNYLGVVTGIGSYPYMAGTTLWAHSTLNGAIMRNVLLDTNPTDAWMYSTSIERIAFRADLDRRDNIGIEYGQAGDMSVIKMCKFTDLDIGIDLTNGTSTSIQIPLDIKTCSFYTSNIGVNFEKCSNSATLTNIQVDKVVKAFYFNNCNTSFHFRLSGLHLEQVPATATEIFHIDNCDYGVFTLNNYDIDSSTGVSSLAVFRISKTDAVGYNGIKMSDGGVNTFTNLLIADDSEGRSVDSVDHHRGTEVTYNYKIDYSNGAVERSTFSGNVRKFLFIPAISDAETGGNLASHTKIKAMYSTMGGFVTVGINLVQIDVAGLTAGNTLWIQGFPEATDGFNRQLGVMTSSSIANATNVCSIGGGTSAIRLTATSGADIKVSDVSTNATLYVSFTYFANPK